MLRTMDMKWNYRTMIECMVGNKTVMNNRMGYLDALMS